MNNIIRIITLMALYAPALLFAGRGRECNLECNLSSDRGSLENCSWSCSDSSSSSGSGSRSEGGNATFASHGSNSGGRGSSSGDVSIPGLGGTALINAQQEVREQVLSECYIAPNGQVCTKAQVIAAAKELSGAFVDALKDKEPLSLVMKQLLAPFFKEEPIPLDCAFAKKAAIEQCQKAAQTVEKEIATKIEPLARAKNVGNLLAIITSQPSGINALSVGQKQIVIAQFGSMRSFAYEAESRTKKCVMQGTTHLCGAHNNLGATTPLNQQQAKLDEIKRILMTQRARGAL